MARSDELVVVVGGIGCGKSAVIRAFEIRGWSVIDADAVARRVLDGMAVEVAARWPSAVGSGTIDRAALAESVFSRREELEELERLVYPSVQAELLRWEQASRRPAAVEVSSPRYPIGPRRYQLLVDLPDEVRRVRLIARGMSVDDIERRFRAQPSRGQWLERASAVVDNSRDRRAIEETITVFDRFWRTQ
jgi:dephospho-CoA kinase